MVKEVEAEIQKMKPLEKNHHFRGKSADIQIQIQIQSHLLPSLSVDLMHECTVWHGSSHHFEDERKIE